MEDKPATTEALTPEIEKKINAWKNMGLAIHKAELSYQVRAQAIIAKLKKPEKIEDIIEAELKLKEAGKEYTALQNDRKQLTSRFDTVAARLSQPEKTVEAAIPEIKNAIIFWKKKKEEEDNKVQYKKDEAKRIREFFINNQTQMDAAYRKKIGDQVLKAYNYALGKGEIKPEDLPDYLPKCKTATGFDVLAFTYDIPAYTATYNSQEEILAIWHEVEKNTKPGEFYVEAYHKALADQFALYDVAFKNKEAAMKLAADNKAKAEADLSKETAAKETAAKLESIAITHEPNVIGPDIKSLKHDYEVDMPDDDGAAIKIIAAFVANFATCRGLIRVKSIRKLSIEQMGDALTKMKKADPLFECGVVFKKVDKL